MKGIFIDLETAKKLAKYERARQRHLEKLIEKGVNKNE